MLDANTRFNADTFRSKVITFTAMSLLKYPETKMLVVSGERA